MATLVESIVKKAQRQLALFTLAFSDVSKSALANQKNIGLDGASQAISVSVLSETKQTLNDMLKGRQTAETQQLAESWWRAHIAWQRSITVTEMVHGVMKTYKREATDEEWRAHVEKLAMPENSKFGPVVLMHDVKSDLDDFGALEYADDGRVLLNQVRQSDSAKTNFEITADPGFYFPVKSIDRLFVRHDAEEQFSIELHSTLRDYVKPGEHRNLDGTVGYRSHLVGPKKTREGEDGVVRKTMPAEPIVVVEDYRYDADAAADAVSFQMALDPAYRSLLVGLRRVAMVQEEYSGLVVRAFQLQGEPEVVVFKGHLVLTYKAQATIVTPAETAVLYQSK